MCCVDAVLCLTVGKKPIKSCLPSVFAKNKMDSKNSMLMIRLKYLTKCVTGISKWEEVKAKASKGNQYGEKRSYENF